MADNTTLNAGSGGDVIASDDIAGVKYQRVKLALGADGTADDAPVGGGVESGALRVTLASDSTGVVSVDDNGGSLTVDGTVAISGTVTVGSHAVTNAGTFATQVDGAALTALQLIDNVVVVEDAAHVSGDSGVMALAVRRDADTTMASADGDYTPLQVNSSGSLKVAITAGAGSGGTSIADGATFTRNTTSLTPVGGIVETSAPTVTNGDAVALSLTTGGAVRVDVASGGITGRAEDAAASGGEEGVPVLAVRRDTASSGVSADGDWANLSVTSDGSLRVATDAATGLTIFRSLDIDESEEEIKATAGRVYFIHAMNMVSTARYLKFYNATAASVTVGTTTPVLTFPVPANSTTGAGFTVSIPQGLSFSTAISVACTTGVADSDTGAPGTNDVIVNIGYV